MAENPISPTREQIERLEDAIADHIVLKKFETRHYFADGLYAREIFIPKNSVLTGKVHRREHINVVSKGCITVWTEDGMKMLCAPCTFVSRPGTKRAGWAHQDTVWTTFHANPTNEQDADVMEELLVEPLRPELITKLQLLCHSLP